MKISKSDYLRKGSFHEKIVTKCSKAFGFDHNFFQSHI